jgi:predicted nucleic acid-binding protein
VPVLFAFVRVSTSFRAFTDPLTIEEAAAHVADWLDQPNALLVETQLIDVRSALTLIRSAGTAATNGTVVAE